MKTSKTYKREYAFALMIALLYTVYMDNVEMVKVIIWPILSFVATSAGLHIYDKTNKPPTNPSTDTK